MNTCKYLVMAFATMAFAACSNDDNYGENNGQPTGQVLNEMSISFGAPVTGRTVAGTTPGDGTENNIYEAFVFAKEEKPGHPRPVEGDWTVIRVTANPIYDNMGRNVDPTEKDKMTALQNGGSAGQWLVKNVATFHGVRQSDYVYVIANDPELTLDKAEALCHKGPDSEKSIREYVAALNKQYINSLFYSPEKDDATPGNTTGKQLPGGKIVMAGNTQIPVNPNVPSNGTTTVVVPLDREVAKVNFRAMVTTSSDDIAFGNVQFKEGDGIVLVRVARSVSPFTKREADFYIPATNFLTNWPLTNVGSGTGKQLNVFDGTTAFNTTEPASNVSEYRFTWALGSGAAMTNNQQPIYLSTASNPMMYVPMLYVTPNYSNDANCATVICTQATYVGTGSMGSEKLYHAELFWEKYRSDNAFGGVTNFKDVVWDKDKLEAFRSYMTDTTNKDDIKKMLSLTDDAQYDKVVAIYPTSAINADSEMYDIKKDDKLFYRCDVSDYENNVSKRITERNMYYQTTATITSLGSPTIEDAIESKENTLHVNVVVKDWTLSMNNVNM